MVLSTQVTVLAVQDLLWGHAMRQFPGLKIAFSEGGIGWLPFLLDRAHRHYQNQRWTGQDFGTKRPSDVPREHSLACSISDPTSLKLYKEIGIDMITLRPIIRTPTTTCSRPPKPLLTHNARASPTRISNEDQIGRMPQFMQRNHFISGTIPHSKRVAEAECHGVPTSVGGRPSICNQRLRPPRRRARRSNSSSAAARAGAGLQRRLRQQGLRPFAAGARRQMVVERRRTAVWACGRLCHHDPATKVRAKSGRRRARRRPVHGEDPICEPAVLPAADGIAARLSFMDHNGDLTRWTQLIIR